MRKFNYILIALIFSCSFKSVAQGKNTNAAERFEIIDGDGNDIITISELIKYYQGKTNKKGRPVDAEMMFYGLDWNNDSIITLKEYVKGVNWKMAKEHKVIKRRGEISSSNLNGSSKKYNTKQVDKFNRIDSDNNEKLNLKEMLAFHEGKLNKKGEPFKANLLFYGLDSNTDNWISLDEFMQKPDWKSARERKQAAKNRIETQKQLSQTEKEKRKLKRQKRRREKENSTGKELTEEPEKVMSTSKNSNVNKEKQINKFRRIDTNGSDEISIEEMILFYAGKMNKRGEPVESELMFYGLDSDNNEKLTFEEFTKKVNWKLAKEKANKQ